MTLDAAHTNGVPSRRQAEAERRGVAGLAASSHHVRGGDGQALDLEEVVPRIASVQRRLVIKMIKAEENGGR